MSDDNAPDELTPDQLQEKFNGLFNTAMDAWIAKKKEESDAEDNAPKRTQKPRNVWNELFGG